MPRQREAPEVTHATARPTPPVAAYRMPRGATPTRVFLLSPAHAGGKRAALLLREEAAFPLAVRLREPGGGALGEAFSFLSGLYFRGKLAYAARFARPPAGVAGVQVITANRGLVAADAPVGPAELRDTWMCCSRSWASGSSFRPISRAAAT
jgi:hypothetical protein